MGPAAIEENFSLSLSPSSHASTITKSIAYARGASLSSHDNALTFREHVQSLRASLGDQMPPKKAAEASSAAAMKRRCRRRRRRRRRRRHCRRSAQARDLLTRIAKASGCQPGAQAAGCGGSGPQRHRAPSVCSCLI